MRQFDYRLLKDCSWSTGILSFIAQIYEHKGRQEHYCKERPVELERLSEIAISQSIESSNKIEGIETSKARLRQIVAETAIPHNSDEQEIAGYRDVLKTIDESYECIPLTADIILQLHRDLLGYTDRHFGGKFKDTQNYIIEHHADGRSFVRFIPLEPFETPSAVQMICASYRDALANELINPLILIPVFLCDFLRIHPFNDGNGRMSRLLTALLLYQSGFYVGRYISLEKKIEQTKDTYYDVLGAVSGGWHEGENDYTPFIKYFLSILLNSYRDLEDRVGSVDQKITGYEKVRQVADSTLGKFTKTEVLERAPSYGSSSVEAALKKLVEEGHIKRIGSGRSTAYVRNFFEREFSVTGTGASMHRVDGRDE